MKKKQNGPITAGDLSSGMIVIDTNGSMLGHKYEIIITNVMDGIQKKEVTIRYISPSMHGDAMGRTWSLRRDAEFEIASEERQKKANESLLTAKKKALPGYFSFKSGADPEIFVVDESGSVIPSWNFLGSKEKPSRPLPDLAYGNNAIYWDGVQAEFDVLPETCLAWTIDSIQRGLAGTLIEARKFNKNAKLSNAAVVMIPDELLSSAKDEHIQFGCMPSKNAYGLTGRNEHGRNVPYRFAGGHIHFGMRSLLASNPEKEALKVIKAMDAILGVACVSLFAEYDAPVRREFYGLAGEYRLPPHGIEYRTLSNAWLMHPLLTNMVFDLARKAAAYGLSDLDNWDATEDETVRAIQECNVDLARSILTRNKDLFQRIVGIFYAKKTEVAASLYMDGLEKFIKSPEDIEENWGLGDPSKWLTHCEGKGKNWSTSFATISKGEKV